MQQGDCNVPVIFQHLMTWIFHDHIRLSVQVYLDNVFIFSDTIDKHKGHLSLVFKVLCKHHLFLSRNKLDLYSEDMDCLGHCVDDQGLHADSDKMSRILDILSESAWRPWSSTRCPRQSMSSEYRSSLFLLRNKWCL